MKSTVEWGTELSAFDHLMYRADLDPRTRTTMLSIEMFDTLPDWERVRQEVDRTSRIAIRLRQRVVEPVVPLTAPRWVVDPDFDLDYHLRRVRLPETASQRQVFDFAQTMFHDPLDARRPLWEAVLLEGVDADGAVAAMIWKFSHATIDGVGAMVLEEAMRSNERDPERGPMPPLPSPEDLSPVDLTRSALRRLPLTLLGTGVRRARQSMSLMGHAMRAPIDTFEQVSKVIGAARRATSPGTEHSPLLSRRGLQRRFDYYEMALADLRAAGKAHGCSLNDAYLAGLAGAMRRYHDALGVPIETIGLGMPINVRASGSPAGGNQWAAAALPLPVSIADPVERMQAIRQVVITARSDSSFNLIGAIAPLATLVPSSLIAGASTSSFGLDIQASNVPGYPVPRYFAGARIIRSIPIGPLPGVSMMATMTSNAGRLIIGFNIDPASFTDVALLRRCIDEGFEEVLAVGRAPVEPPPKPQRRRATKATSKPRVAKRTTPSTRTRS